MKTLKYVSDVFRKRKLISQLLRFSCVLLILAPTTGIFLSQATGVSVPRQNIISPPQTANSSPRTDISSLQISISSPLGNEISVSQKNKITQTTSTIPQSIGSVFFPLRANTNKKYLCPVTNCEVSKPFIIGENNWNPGHRGVDLKAMPGAEIRSPESGTVFYVGKIANRTVLSIEHPDGKRSTFEPISTTLEKGQQVQRGESIGTLLPFHCAPFSCLHWGVKTDSNTYLNPLSLLFGKTVWLLK
ncbi:MAG: M23 family metallopeptidase [Arcanobacterium sp.]|nr:M23 family metallopeptidase [Arcanobacterium sp.]